ncbi:MAG: hypothetical protein K6G90_00750 [Clostridia bacterium]|nr:hypothetical protein [Clostridia bacterium]
MKKIIAALLCAILALSLCACGAKNAPADSDTTEPVTGTDTGTTAEEETPDPAETGIEIDCGEFSVSVPESWKDRFVTETEDGFTKFYFADAYGQPDYYNGGDGWLFSLCLSDIPDFSDRPVFGDQWETFEIAKLIRGGEEKYISAQRSAASMFSPEDRAEAGAMIDLAEKLGAGIRAKDGAETETLDYSGLAGAAWFSEVSEGKLYKFRVNSVTANFLYATVVYNADEQGIWDNLDATVRMYGDSGYMTWVDNYTDMTFAPSGSGSVEFTGDDKIFFSMSSGDDLRYNIENGVILDREPVPAPEEIEYVSGVIKESCDYFGLSLPDCWKGLYTCEKSADSLRFYHTESKADWGGFIFALSVREPDIEREAYDFVTPFRRLVTDEGEKYICIQFPSDMQVKPQWMEQYDAMNKGINAALETLTPADPGAKLVKFDIGFTSGKYSGTNEKGDRFELILKRETIYNADADLIFYPVTGEKSVAFEANCYEDEGRYNFSYSNYTGSSSGYTYGSGTVEFDGDTIRLTLSNSDGDTPVDDGGVITLTAEH